VNTSADVRLENVHVYFGKGYVVRAWGTDGFAFVHSSVSNAGVIGLYVGHFKFGPSRRVAITDSIIARSRTNGIALVGADGASPADPVLVANNILVNNHWHVLWPSSAVPGGIAGGGQLLVADGKNIRVSGNLFADGNCDFCNPTHAMTAIEIADQAAPSGGVQGLTIDHNIMVNGVGVAIYQNQGMLASGISLQNNHMRGFSTLDIIKSPATSASNALERVCSRAAAARRPTGYCGSREIPSTRR
jgi:hypothetical protein